MLDEDLVDNAVGNNTPDGTLAVVGIEMEGAKVSMIGVWKDGALRPLTQRESEQVVKWWDKQADNEEAAARYRLLLNRLEFRRSDDEFFISKEDLNLVRTKPIGE